MRVLIATDTYPPDLSGSSFFADRLARGLAARGLDVHVVCASDTGPRTDVVRDGVALHRLRSVPLLIHPTVRFVPPPGVHGVLRRLVARVRPDVLHTQDHFTIGRAAVAAAVRSGIPVVATNHFMPDNLLPYLPRWLHAAVSWLAWRDFHRIYRHADHLTTPTRVAADLVARTGFEREVEPVSCGVDLSRFRTPAASATDPRMWARKELELPDLPTIAFVGRLDAEKRLDELIRALARITARVRAQLVLAGRGTRRAELERLACAEGVREHVHFLGFVPDEQLPAVYAAADVFAMPGVAELQSIATLEAMASGLPVVAADAVALPHLVSPGENGFLFTSGDVAGLAAVLTRILTSPELRDRMGAVSLAMASRHDQDRTLERFEEIYAAVSAGRGPAAKG
ncbi:glycosyltransferase [Prauserella muralis]|uniref:Glucosyl transferase n=1 Tax=Prauserella muralis TaxID=588067 RepID=A0A2V4APT9_9PSEU|nr:glycosyltransferase [Prauserella muralis]PXY22597.1 glucosyl transferase [Prauserella muralis]TWE28297.1 glycosyltransferase involved in cell wall biosynthesis [Prauserella muralis]